MTTTPTPVGDKPPVKKAAGRPKAAPKAPYGNVTYADPGYQADKKKRYPVDTKEHAAAAWSYINKASNQSAYSSSDLAKVKDAIRSAAQKFGMTIADSDAKSASTDETEISAVPDVDKSTSTPDAVRKDTSGAAKKPEDAVRKDTSTGPAEHEIRKVEPKVKTLEELRARLAEIAERMQEVGEETRDAELDAETQAEWDGMEAEEAEVRSSIDRIEKRMESLKARAISKPAATERGSGEAPAFHKKQENIYDLAQVRMDSNSPEHFSEKVRDNALRAVEAATYRIPRSARATKEDAQTYVESLLNEVDTRDGMLAKRLLITGSPVYERAFGKFLLAGGNDSMCSQEEREALFRAQTLGTDSSGGFAMPFQLDPTVILINAGVTNPIREIAQVRQIVGKELDLVTSQGATAVRGPETGQAAPDNTLTLAQPTLRTNRVSAFVPFTIESELGWNGLRSEITKVMIDAKNREEDSFITGDGSTGQQPGGVVGSLSGNTVTAGGVASFAAADIYSLQAALDPRWEGNSSWLAHKAIYHKLRQFDTAGGAQLWAQIGQGRPNELMGYPAAAASAMDSVLTTGKKIVLYGDFQQFLILDRIGMQVEAVPMLFDTSTGRPTGQRGVYAIWMNNSKVLVHSAFKLLVTG